MREREFNGLIGTEATRKLVEAFGGTRLYIPMACRLRQNHKLVHVLGWNAALILCHEYGGLPDLKIPTCQEPRSLDRRKIIMLRAQAMPISQIALTMHCTEKAIYEHLHKANVFIKKG